MKTQEVLVKNFSNVVSQQDLNTAVAASQIQVSRDFAPAWGVDAKLSIAVTDAEVPEECCLIAVFDDEVQANKLGYHETTYHGDPIAKVFAKDSKDDGAIWTLEFSHELLAMLADPAGNICAVDEGAHRLWAYEICAPVEPAELGYEINGVLVSDFVLPSYFEIGVNRGLPTDFREHLKAPLAIMPGGHLLYSDFQSDKGWQRLEARRSRLWRATTRSPGRAREQRRSVPHDKRLRSTRH